MKLAEDGSTVISRVQDILKEWNMETRNYAGDGPAADIAEQGEGKTLAAKLARSFNIDL
jgi:hypothetical protein